MPRTFKYNDVETTYELKTYELTLTCGKCIPTGQLIATGEPTEDNQTLHVCNQCGREQLITGPVYPRTETRKVPTQRNIERTEVIPDDLPLDYYPDYEKDRAAMSELSVQQQVDLLRTTKKPVMVDHLEYATTAYLHRLFDLSRELFDMARQAATHRADTMPAEIDDRLLEGIENYHLSIKSAVEIITKTCYVENVTKIQQALDGRLIALPELRSALYAIARQVVTLRNQPEPPPIESKQLGADTLTKNKGGRPRKQVAIA